MAKPHVVELHPLVIGLREGRAVGFAEGVASRPPPPPDPQGWLTIRQAAARLAVSERTVRKLVDSGTLPYRDVGEGRERRAVRVAPADIEAFEQRRRGKRYVAHQ